MVDATGCIAANTNALAKRAGAIWSAIHSWQGATPSRMSVGMNRSRHTNTGNSFTEPAISITYRSQWQLIVRWFMHMWARSPMAISGLDRSFELWDCGSTAFILCVIQEELLSMRDRVTFCIKTIYRPHCCAKLVRSIYEQCGDNRPLIHVLDDGRPD